MKKPWLLFGLGAIVMLGGLAFGYRFTRFYEQRFLLKEAEETYRITVKETKDPEHDRKLKVILLKEYLLSQYLKEKPEAWEKAIQKYQDTGSLFVINVPETGVKLLNVSERRCTLPAGDQELKVPVGKLADAYCFAADNVAYFKDVDEARFRIEAVGQVEAIADSGVQAELKARLKEEIKSLAVADYIQKHRGF